MLVPRLIDNVIAGNAITLQGEDGIKINPIHVSDAVAALEACMKLEGSHTFNVAGTQTLSLREIACTIGKAVGREPVFKIDSSEPPSFDRRYRCTKRYLGGAQGLFCPRDFGIVSLMKMYKVLHAPSSVGGNPQALSRALRQLGGAELFLGRVAKLPRLPGRYGAASSGAKFSDARAEANWCDSVHAPAFRCDSLQRGHYAG